MPHRSADTGVKLKLAKIAVGVAQLLKDASDPRTIDELQRGQVQTQAALTAPQFGLATAAAVLLLGGWELGKLIARRSPR